MKLEVSFLNSQHPTADKYLEPPETNSLPHVLTYSFNTHLHSILLPTSTPPQRSHPSGILTKILYAFLISQMHRML
jgi:hypothetical protein